MELGSMKRGQGKKICIRPLWSFWAWSLRVSREANWESFCSPYRRNKTKLRLAFNFWCQKLEAKCIFLPRLPMFCKMREILASASNVRCRKLGPRAKNCVGLFLSTRTWSSKVPRNVELWFVCTRHRKLEAKRKKIAPPLIFGAKSWRLNTKKLFSLFWNSQA
jgi:hypothetical protein